MSAVIANGRLYPTPLADEDSVQQQVCVAGVREGQVRAATGGEGNEQACMCMHFMYRSKYKCPPCLAIVGVACYQAALALVCVAHVVVCAWRMLW